MIDAELRQCRECGDPFSLSVPEQLFFERKGLSLPRRCKACRAARRDMSDQERVTGQRAAPREADQ